MKGQNCHLQHTPLSPPTRPLLLTRHACKAHCPSLRQNSTAPIDPPTDRFLAGPAGRLPGAARRPASPLIESSGTDSMPPAGPPLFLPPARVPFPPSFLDRPPLDVSLDAPAAWEARRVRGSRRRMDIRFG
jgi:hypothetical protein